jgi:hypothetical protein
MKDFHPKPGVNYSEATVTSFQQLLQPGFMECLIIAGRSPSAVSYTTDNPRKPKGNGHGGEMEYHPVWHRYIVVPPPGTTRNSTEGGFGIGDHRFYDESGEELPSPQTFTLNAYGHKLFRRRHLEALNAIPVSLGPRGRDTFLRKLVEGLGF